MSADKAAFDPLWVKAEKKNWEKAASDPLLKKKPKKKNREKATSLAEKEASLNDGFGTANLTLLNETLTLNEHKPLYLLVLRNICATNFAHRSSTQIQIDN